MEGRNFCTQATERGDIFYIAPEPYFDRDSHVLRNDKGRYGVIVSNNAANASALQLVVYLTTSERRSQYLSSTEINSTGRRSWAVCNQPTPVDRSRLRTYVGHVTKDEMERIDDALRYSLGLVESPMEEAKKRAEDAFRRFLQRVSEISEV